MMKKRLLSILIAATVFTAVLPTFAPPKTAYAATNFKFIDTHKNRLGGWANWGRCYFEYEINGKRYMSDKNANQADNARAWSLMSDKEKKQLAELFVGRKEIRDDQFGEDVSAQITKFVNDENKWTEAAEKLARKIEMKYMKDDLICHYSDAYIPGKNVSYYDYAMDFYNLSYGDNLYASLVSGNDGRSDIYAMIHKQQQAAACMREGKAIYNELVQTKRLALQTATQAASGELISLIMDKAFIPKIAESTIKDVAIEVWNLLDKGLNITDNLKDKVFNTKDGKTVSFDAAEEVFKVLNDRSERYEKSCRMLYQKADSLMYEIGQEAPKIDAKIKADKAAAQTRKNDLEMELLRIKNPPYDPDISYSESVKERIEAIEKLPAYTDEETEAKTARLKEVKAFLRGEMIQKYTEYVNDYQNWQDTWETTLRNLANDDSPTIDGEPLISCYDAGFKNAAELENIKANISATKSFMNQSLSYMSTHNDAAKSVLETETEKSLEFTNRHDELISARDILYNKGGGYVDFAHETGLYPTDNRISFEVSHQRLDLNSYPEFETTKRYSFFGKEEYLNTIADEIVEVGIYEEMYKNHAANMDDYYEVCKTENTRYTELTKKLANDYIAAQANYDNAMRFYEADYNEIKRRIEALPTYVKNQQVERIYGSFGVSVYAPYFRATNNPELADAFFGVYGTEREARGRQYADQLRPLLKTIEEYKEDMEDEYQKAKYYKEQMNDAYTKLCYGGWHYDECGIGIVYPDLGTGSEGSSGITISVPSDLPLAPKKLSFTSDDDDRMQALKLLYDDFSGMSYYQSQIACLIDRLKDCKGQIYREAASGGESATLREITAEYRSIVWGYIRTCSWLGVGSTGDEDPEFEEQLAQINDAIGKTVFVRGISKGARASLFSAANYDLTITEGETGKLNAFVYPADATDTRVVWESEDTDIAMVFSDGTVKGCSAGEVKIKAHPSDSIKLAVDQYGNALEIDKNGNPIIPEGSDSAAVGFTYRVTDEAGDYVTAEIEYTVKVEPRIYDCNIDGIAVLDDSGNELDNIPIEGGFRVSIPVTNADGGVVILAVYDMDGCMTELYEAQDTNGTAEFEVENARNNADGIKAFLWNSIEDMTPITKAAGFDWITKAPDEDIEYTDLPNGLEHADIFAEEEQD